MVITELIEIIRPRSAMYIGKHNIFCLKAFIDGWYFRNTAVETNIGILNEFYSWLLKKYDANDDRNWDELLFLVFGDEAKALDNFFLLFDEYISET